MNKAIRRVIFLGAALSLTACGSGDAPQNGTAAASDEPVMLSAVIDALGGAELLNDDTIINVTRSGASFEPHEDGPEHEELNNLVTRYRTFLTASVGGDRLNLESRREFIYPFPYTGGATIVVNGQEGSIHGINGFQARYFGLTVPRPLYSRRLEAVNKTQLMSNPYRLVNRLRREHGDAATSTDSTFEIELAAGLPPVVVEVDAQTGLPRKASAVEWDYLMGDVTYEVLFADWQPAEAGQYPRSITHRLDGFTLRSETVEEVTFGDHLVDVTTFVTTAKPVTYVNIENPEIVVEQYDPIEGRKGLESSQWSYRMMDLGFNQDLPIDDVVITKENRTRNRDIEVGGNVYMVEGNTDLMAYASIAIEMSDGVYVVEPVLNPYRSRVAIDAIKQRFPGKPLLGIIATHHHMDHFGGIRTYAAETGKVYVGEGGLDFTRGVLDRRGGVFTDELDTASVDVEVIGVSERLRIGEGDDAFELIPYPTPHSDDMLLVYFPAIKALAVADVFNGEMADGLRFYTPGTAAIMARRAGVLQEFITGNNLEVETLLAIHGGAVSSRELMAFLAPAGGMAPPPDGAGAPQQH